MNIPNCHQIMMPYLIVAGADKFIEFTRNVFGATENRDMRSVREDGETVRHSEVRIGGCTIMFADATDQFPPQTSGLFIYVEDADETYQKALAEGATSLMGLSDQYYGRTCGITDPLGNTWWITSVK